MKVDRKQTLRLHSRAEWEAWLDANHASSAGVWLVLSKKGVEPSTVSRADALEVALCYGWIDGQAGSLDEGHWVQRFTPRTRRSRWSRINRDAATRLIANGLMKPAGLKEVEAAQRDGRWERAYEPPTAMEVPDDLRAALEQHPHGVQKFEQLNASSRYSVLYRIHDAKKPETRARRIAKYVDMVVRGERIT